MDSKHCNYYNTPLCQGVKHKQNISLENIKILCVEKVNLSIILEELFVVVKIPDIIVTNLFLGHPNHQIPLPPIPTEKSAFLE